MEKNELRALHDDSRGAVELTSEIWNEPFVRNILIFGLLFMIGCVVAMYTGFAR